MQYTYPQLLASCQNYCVDNSIEFINEFPNIVQLAEMRIIKDLSLSIFDKQVNGNLSSGNNELIKPSGFIDIRSLYIVVAGNNIALQLRSKSYLDDYWRNVNNLAQPIYYAEASTTFWQITPTPDQSYGYQVNYVARPTPMSPTTPTTYIGNRLGELLLYAVLIDSMIFFREDVVSAQGLTQTWKTEYQNGLIQAQNELLGQVSGVDQKIKPIIEQG